MDAVYPFTQPPWLPRSDSHRGRLIVRRYLCDGTEYNLVKYTKSEVGLQRYHEEIGVFPLPGIEPGASRWKREMVSHYTIADGWICGYAE